MTNTRATQKTEMWLTMCLITHPLASKLFPHYPGHNHLTYLQWTIVMNSYCTITCVHLRTLLIKIKACTAEDCLTVRLSPMKLAVHCPWTQAILLELSHLKAQMTELTRAVPCLQGKLALPPLLLQGNQHSRYCRCLNNFGMKKIVYMYVRWNERRSQTFSRAYYLYFN